MHKSPLHPSLLRSSQEHARWLLLPVLPTSSLWVGGMRSEVTDGGQHQKCFSLSQGRVFQSMSHTLPFSYCSPSTAQNSSTHGQYEGKTFPVR